MRLNIKYLLGFFALLLFLPACKNNDEVEEATLELSSQALAFAKDASEQVVTVTTNKDNWSAFSTQEAWLTTEQSGNSLKVKVAANTVGRDRAASIIVNAGGLQKRIAVKQSAADAVLEPEEASVYFPVEGGVKKVAFSSNGGDVKVELGAAVDWLSIEKVTANSFVLVAKESTQASKRSVKVNLTVGTTIKEIEVVQEGTVQYVLPLLKFPASLSEVLRYEQGRGHSLIKIPDGLFNTTLYRFLTKSKVMTFIQYEFANESAIGFTSAATLCEEKYAKDNADFDAALKEQGFEKAGFDKDGKTVLYRNAKLPLLIRVAFKDGAAAVVTSYDPVQDKDYPTFKTLPMTNQTQYMGDRDLKIAGKKRAEIHDIEKGWGSTLNDFFKQNNYENYKITKAFEGEYARGYFYVVPDKKIPKDDPYVDVLHNVQGMYKDISLGFWTDALGRKALTKEVVKLFTDNNFPYFGALNGGAQAFYNKDKKMAYVIRTVKDSETKEVIFEIQAFYEDVDAGSSTSIMPLANYAQQIKAYNAKQAALRKLEGRLVKTPLR